MLYQLSYSRGVVWCNEITAKKPDDKPARATDLTPAFPWPYGAVAMATPPLSPATRRLTGLMCMVSGALLLLGLGLKIELGIYICYLLGVPFPSTALLLFQDLRT